MSKMRLHPGIGVWLKAGLRYLPWIVGLWLTLAFVGYGLALKSYGRGTSGPTAAPVWSIDGEEIAWVDKTMARMRGAKFHVHNRKGTLVVLPEFIKDEAAWNSLESALIKGNRMRVSFLSDSLWVVSLSAWAPNESPRPIVELAYSEQMRKNMSFIYDSRGNNIIFAGLLLLPAVGLLSWAVRKALSRFQS